jgi:hypothetical protein
MLPEELLCPVILNNEAKSEPTLVAYPICGALRNDGKMNKMTRVATTTIAARSGRSSRIGVGTSIARRD